MTGTRLLPSDLLIAAYNLAMACVWAGSATRTPAAPWLIAAHAAAAVLPWVVRARWRAPAAGAPPPLAALREGYPLLALAFFWSELGFLQHVRQAHTHDLLVAAWDRAVFGVHLHAAWPAAAPQRWLDEAMQFSYFSYYLLLAVPPVAVALARRREAFRDLMLRLMATYLTCFLFYTVFPVYGPRSLVEAAAVGAEVAPVAARPGLFEALIEGMRAAGDSPGTAFPSSHVAGALTVAWFGCLWLGRAAAAVLCVLTALVTVGTVYTGNHFAIDSLAGLLWGAGAQALLVPALARRPISGGLRPA